MDTPASRACGIHAARLNLADYAANFSDAHPPLTRAQALIEAERCYYCHDAPCATACPTGIDIPSFIHRIAQDNNRGAARAILEANPLGGMCARVCPTEELCEQACVRNTELGKPVEIGRLQRFAVDKVTAPGATPLFTRAAPTGKHIAVGDAVDEARHIDAGRAGRGTRRIVAIQAPLGFHQRLRGCQRVAGIGEPLGVLTGRQSGCLDIGNSGEGHAGFSC